MSKFTKGHKITLAIIVGLMVLIFVIAGMAGNSGSNDNKEAETALNEHCEAIAGQLNETYKPNGFEVLGFASKADNAVFAVNMPYTADEVKNIYSQEKQLLRDLWGDIARRTWDYLSEKGYETPADIEVNVQVYATDKDECIVYLTKHDTTLKD